MTLPTGFLTRPLAHRGYHKPGTPENSRAAFEAAIASGYGIELDVQLSRDGIAMVFHDDTLDRMTKVVGPLRGMTSKALGDLTLQRTEQCIPTLEEVLSQVNARAALLLEIKDQDGALGQNVGPLEEAVADALDGYDGPAAVMSFNPNAVACMAELCPSVPRGLTTCAFNAEDWPDVPAKRRAVLAGIPDYREAGACFISHEASDLRAPRVAKLKQDGAKILTWTIRSPEEEAASRALADNITFEGYAAGWPS